MLQLDCSVNATEFTQGVPINSRSPNHVTIGGTA